MNDEQAILSAIATHSREDTPRMVYADYLEEHGRPEQAKFVREQRTGKAVEKLRSQARAASGSANQTSKRGASGGYRESVVAKRASREASRLGQAYQHAQAVEAHDRAAMLHDEATERGLTDRNLMNISYAPGHMRAMAEHFEAAHHHEIVLHHLGSPAYLASDKAFEASKAVRRAEVEGEHTSPHGLWSIGQPPEVVLRLHAKARAAHLKAAKLHEQEGNTAAAYRHTRMHEYHHDYPIQQPPT